MSLAIRDKSQPAPYSRIEAESAVSMANRMIDNIDQNVSNLAAVIAKFVERQGWKVLGYKSMDECARARFPKLSERASRRLFDAAEVFRNLGLPETSTVTARVIAPLSVIPVAEQAEVWDGLTGGDPGVVPTLAAVESAVKEHRTEKERKVEKAFADETEDGTTTRTVVGRDPGDDDEDVDGSTADAEPREAASPEDDFIRELLANEKCPYHDMPEHLGKGFLADAVGWFHLESARTAYRAQVSEQRNLAEKRCKKATLYLSNQAYMIRREGPKKWVTCRECGGTGKRTVADRTTIGCGNCDGHGYRI